MDDEKTPVSLHGLSEKVKELLESSPSLKQESRLRRFARRGAYVLVPAALLSAVGFLYVLLKREIKKNEIYRNDAQAYESSIRDLENTANGLKKRVDFWRRRYDDSAVESQDKDTEINALEAQVEEYKVQLASAQSSIADYEESQKKRQAELETLKEQVIEFRKSISSKDEKAEELEDKISEYEADIKKKERESESLRQKLEESKQSLAELSSGSREEILRLKKRIAELNSDIRKLNSANSGLTSSLEDLQEKFEDYKKYNRMSQGSSSSRRRAPGQRTPNAFSRSHIVDFLYDQDSCYAFLELDSSILGGSSRFGDIPGAGAHYEYKEILSGRFYLPLSESFFFDISGALSYSGHNQELGKHDVERYSRISSNLDAVLMLALGTAVPSLGVRMKRDDYQELGRGTTPMFEAYHHDDGAVRSYDIGPFIGFALHWAFLHTMLRLGRQAGDAVYDATTPGGETLRADRSGGFAQLRLRVERDDEPSGFFKNTYLSLDFDIEYLIDNFNVLSMRQETLHTAGRILAGKGLIDVDKDGRDDIGVRLGFGYENFQSYGDRFNANRTIWGPRLEIPIRLGNNFTLVPYIGHKQSSGNDDAEVGILLTTT